MNNKSTAWINAAELNIWYSTRPDLSQQRPFFLGRHVPRDQVLSPTPQVGIPSGVAFSVNSYEMYLRTADVMRILLGKHHKLHLLWVSRTPRLLTFSCVLVCKAGDRLSPPLPRPPSPLPSIPVPLPYLLLQPWLVDCSTTHVHHYKYAPEKLRGRKYIWSSRS